MVHGEMDFCCGDFVDGSVLFELLRCAQCNHAFACSLAATMHTHTAPPTSYCTVFHSLTAFVSSIPQVHTNPAAVGLSAGDNS